MMFHRRRRIPTGLLALLCAGSLLGACSSSGDDASDSTASGAATTEATSTSAAPGSSVASTAPRPTTTTRPPTTTAAPHPVKRPVRLMPAPVWPLTGKPHPDPDIARRPALVVKVDNASGARPQTGFNEADIVFEEIVNDSLTRFALVFHSNGSPVVGPIRSGRLQDIDIFGSFNGPLFAWSGGNATVTNAIRASDLIEIGPTRAYSAYYRSGDRAAPHNLYSSTDALLSYAPPTATPPQQQFRYRTRRDPLPTQKADGVAVTLDSIDVAWTWDPASGVYRRTMEGAPHEDRGSGQVTADNVLVLVMQYASGISGSPDALVVGEGEAFVFTGGRYVHGTWIRRDRTQPFQLRDKDNTPILLTPGRTFVELPRAGATTPFLAD